MAAASRINYIVACRPIEKVSEQCSRWLKSLSFFKFEENHRTPWVAIGTTASGFRGIIPSILRYALSERCRCWSTSAPPFSHMATAKRNPPLSLILRPRGTSRPAYFSRTLFFSCLSRVHGAPLWFRLLCSRHRLRMENRGSTNGLPWLGGLRTSMWKGEINQANRSFSPDHWAELDQSPSVVLVPDCDRIFAVTSLKKLCRKLISWKIISALTCKI